MVLTSSFWENLTFISIVKVFQWGNVRVYHIAAKKIVIPDTFENEDVYLRISKTTKRVHT